jgi:hypothetical protein
MDTKQVSTLIILAASFAGGTAQGFTEAPAAAAAAQKETLYTGLGVAGGAIWVASATKSMADRFPEPRLQRYQSAGKEFEIEWVLEAKIFRGREVRAVVPMKTPQGGAAMGVISQWSVEQGDEPEIHAIELSEAFKKGTQPWVKLSKAPCVDIDSIQVEGSKVSYQCSDEQKLDPKTRKIVKRPVSAELKTPRDLLVQGWKFEVSNRTLISIPLREQEVPARSKTASEIAKITGPDWGWTHFKVVDAGTQSAQPLFEKKLGAE